MDSKSEVPVKSVKSDLDLRSLLGLCLTFFQMIDNKNEKIKKIFKVITYIQLLYQMGLNIKNIIKNKKKPSTIYNIVFDHTSTYQFISDVCYGKFIDKVTLLKYIFQKTQIRHIYKFFNDELVSIDDDFKSLLVKEIPYVIEFRCAASEFDMLLLFEKKIVSVFVNENLDAKEEFIKFQSQVIYEFTNQILNISKSDYYIEFIPEPLTNCVYKSNKIYIELDNIICNALTEKKKVGILLHGKPGVSKTQTIKYTLSKLKLDKPILKLSINNNINSSIFKPFLDAIDAYKIIIFEDIDIDELKNKNNNCNNLLSILDSNVYDVFICTSNNNTIDPSLLRSGRCDLKIHCKVPDDSECFDIINILMHEYNVETLDKPPFKFLYGKNLTHSDINAIFKKAMLRNVSILESYEEHIKSNNEYEEIK